MYFYKSDKYAFRSTPDNIPNAGEYFVDHSKNGRGGHLGHAMVEYAPNSILCFYANCDDSDLFHEIGEVNYDTDFIGHSGRGWTEYKRSTDGGKTWSEGKPLAYSKQLYESGGIVSSFCEKAVMADDGAIVLFHLHCYVEKDPIWEPYLYPRAQRSTDGGETWEPAVKVFNGNARIWDVTKKDGKIYVLFSEGKAKGLSFRDYDIAVTYYLYASDDNGKSFYQVSRIPVVCDAGTIYGTMEYLKDGRMIVYIYSCSSERYMKYFISEDGGKTWTEPMLSRFEKQIRNPQCIKFKDTYFMFGRAGIYGTEEEKGHNVMYVSDDCINWDEGRFISMDEVGFTTAYYSNAIIVGEEGKERLLYQYSKGYRRALTNVMHRWIDADEI